MQRCPAGDSMDVALLQRLAHGDQGALNALYDGHRRRLARFLTRISKRQDVIEEALNDTFWIVWQKAGTFQGESRVSTWLTGIAYRSALKVLRHKGAPAGEGDADDHASHDPDEERELRDWVSKALLRLPNDQRLVLELAYGGGHSVGEISSIMKCPEGTVKARMSHARSKLRRLLPALASAGDAAQHSQAPQR